MVSASVVGAVHFKVTEAVLELVLVLLVLVVLLLLVLEVLVVLLELLVVLGLVGLLDTVVLDVPLLVVVPLSALFEATVVLPPPQPPTIKAAMVNNKIFLI